MKKETVDIFCDLCGNKIYEGNLYTGTSEQNTLGIVSITYDIWYGGHFKITDTCIDCNKAMSDFLKQKKFASNGQKQ